jgi:hypothetical protein
MGPRIQFLSANRSPYSASGRSAPPPPDTSLFWWTILIFVLTGLATFSWMGSLYVFNHPEKPKNYRLLAKLKKIEPLKKFSESDLPQGKFQSAKELYRQYFGYESLELDTFNNLLKRSYIQNYRDQAPLYLKGDFTIDKVVDLTANDIFSRGLVIRATSEDLPNVQIELILPTDEIPKNRPSTGDELRLKNNHLFASLIHVSRPDSESLCFTAVPLTYPQYQVSETEKIALRPPTLLNLTGTWPLTDATPPPAQAVESPTTAAASPPPSEEISAPKEN